MRAQICPQCRSGGESGPAKLEGRRLSCSAGCESLLGRTPGLRNRFRSRGQREIHPLQSAALEWGQTWAKDWGEGRSADEAQEVA